MGKYWFRDGLRFECTRCGHCCTGDPGYVWVTSEELQAIADHLGQPLEEVRSLYARRAGRRVSLREKTNGDCVFFDRTSGCTVYSARPTQCRTWPFWESNTESREAWDRAAERCPGMNQGPLISADDITQRVRKVRV